jgi:hypothetical protein
MERDTQNFITKNGITVVYKTYLTGRELRELQNIFLKDVSISQGESTPTIGNIKADSLVTAQDFLVSTLIVSIDGDTEKLVEKVLNLRAEDTQEIFAKVSEISNSWSEKKRT